MSRAEEAGLWDFEGLSEEVEDRGAKGVTLGLEAKYQVCVGGEERWKWLEFAIRVVGWWRDVEGFFWVAVFCAFWIECFALHRNPAAVCAACFVGVDGIFCFLFFG